MVPSEVVNSISKKLSGSDAEFFKRIWSSDIEVYQNRLNAIGFNGFENVLDAGFGMGQWAIALSKNNTFVNGIEFSPIRTEVVNELFNSLKITNAKLQQGSIEEMPYTNNFFDAVFCYGVIFCTDFKKSLSELYRVLKPGGKLYFSANGLGWFLMCAIEEHNKSENYNPRQMAADAIEHSFNYFSNEQNFEKGKQLFVTKEHLDKLLTANGFKNSIIQSEGTININNFNAASLSFYKHQSYLGKDFIFDIYCEK